MNQPVEPFRIMGNLYYVGANSVADYLITTPEGHILIDGGFVETVPLIQDSVAKLGFHLEDVKLLLNSHAHLDHAGGLARLKELTAASLAASEGDTGLLERGGLGDPILGDQATFPPVGVDRRLKDGETVSLGGMVLTARVTAGHTPGCTSWDFEVREGEATYRAVSICSLTILKGTRLKGEPTYPGIAEDFARSIETLRALPVDVFLASHATFFRMDSKRKALGGEGPNPFVDADGYRAYLDRAERRLQAALAAEAPAP